MELSLENLMDIEKKWDITDKTKNLKNIKGKSLIDNY